MSETISELINRLIDLKLKPKQINADKQLIKEMVTDLDRKIEDFEPEKLKEAIDDLKETVELMGDDFKDLERRIGKIEYGKGY